MAIERRTYVIAVLVQFPFMNTTYHVGFIAQRMNGADIAWIVGLVVAFAIYYFPMHTKLRNSGIGEELGL
ncbi:hypothetical protein NZD89_14995 [Alicyclobacillus fastidiosus]|uniref:Uncharacterized protein n=1 Tax=Alicyclobacillus fastidiosus TaxID=392011 RepID=A0ABY6ZA36_9BACL|nr:hypothetical protein [Alicyclobacillus fastidiosus]WAH39721.1 hypothetical protein NZD89_14995 [Alicyclobacillus fastidiosus]GMA60946.1 hypothetical protein GCM10025859_13860 [Alicyclobacillus fastidiosus]